MMMKGTLSFSPIQRLLFRPFGAETGRISSCIQGPRMPLLAYSTKRKEYYFTGFPVKLASEV